MAGEQPAQQAQALITSNSILFSNPQIASTPNALLLSSAIVVDHAQFPPIDTTLASAVTAGTQTVQASNTAYLQPGMVFSSGNVLASVVSVNAAAGTITANFSGPLAAGAEMHAYVIGNSTGSVSVGQHLMTIASSLGGTAVALYAGEVLQINPVNVVSNDVVVVQKVVSPTSFIATFNKAQTGTFPIYSINFQGSGTGAGSGQYNFTPAPADSPPDGTPVYVEEYSGAFAANSGNTQVVEVGSTTKSTSTIQYYDLPGNPTGVCLHRASGLNFSTAS